MPTYRKVSPTMKKKGDGEDDTLKNLPFSRLAELMEKRRPSVSVSQHQSLPKATPPQESPVSPDPDAADRKLFLNAMAGVLPLRERATIPHEVREVGMKAPSAPTTEDSAVLRELSGLVSGMLPVLVSKTPEFIESDRDGDIPFLVKRLHRGEFSVQGYCDLHECDSLTAIQVCENFMAEHLARGTRCVAFIHGRGLSSPRAPVLKGLVLRWLERGPFRRHVRAFCSAPHWDGGAGVTYVLLRGRPRRRSKGKGDG